MQRVSEGAGGEGEGDELETAHSISETLSQFYAQPSSDRLSKSIIIFLLSFILVYVVILNVNIY